MKKIRHGGKMNNEEKRKNFNMIATARVYLERPDDEIFKKLEKRNPKAFKNLQILAKALKNHIDKGDIT